MQAQRFGVDEVVLVELGVDADVAPLGHDEVVHALVGAAADPLHLVFCQRAAAHTGVSSAGVPACSGERRSPAEAGRDSALLSGTDSTPAIVRHLRDSKSHRTPYQSQMGKLRNVAPALSWRLPDQMTWFLFPKVEVLKSPGKCSHPVGMLAHPAEQRLWPPAVLPDPLPVIRYVRYAFKDGQEVWVVVVAGGAAILVVEERAALVGVLFVIQQPCEAGPRGYRCVASRRAYYSST